MSVVGATEWYTKSALEHRRELLKVPLVLKQYPVDFLNEAASKIGSDFYSTICLDGHYLKEALDPNATDCWRSSPKRIVGPLLPFTDTQTQLSPFSRSMQFAKFKDHPSIKSWEILSTGSVHIKQAAIVASTKGVHKTGKPGIFETHPQSHDALGHQVAETITEILAPEFMAGNSLLLGTPPEVIEVGIKRFEDQFELFPVGSLQEWLDTHAGKAHQALLSVFRSSGGIIRTCNLVMGFY